MQHLLEFQRAGYGPIRHNVEVAYALAMTSQFPWTLPLMWLSKKTVDRPAVVSSRLGLFGRIGAWFDDHWAELVQHVCTVLMAASALFFGIGWPEYRAEHGASWGIWLTIVGFSVFILSGLGYIICAVLATRSKPSITQLQEKNRILSVFVDQLPSKYMRTLAQDKLGFGERDDNTERVTLYRHEPPVAGSNHDGRFIRVCRYSSNPEYDGGGRSEYPADQGCIAEAKRHGGFFRNDFADPSSAKVTYRNEQVECGVPEDVADNLRMKSRLYAAVRIMFADDVIAVIVVESTDPNRWTKAQIHEAIGETERVFIGQLLQAVASRLPDPRTSREAGL